MTVLTILGVLAAALMIYGFITFMNGYTYRKFQFKFFNEVNIFLIPIAYVAIFFGYSSYQDALKATNGDPLNGALIVAIGAIILLGQIYINFKNTNFKYGLFGTMIQFILYVPITVVALGIIAIMFAFFADSKPVYNINSRD